MTSTARLVVRDRVEEGGGRRVDARVAHGAERAEHGRAAVLELDEGRGCAPDVLDPRQERVAARDGADVAVVAAREVLRAARVLGRGHGADLGEAGEGDDLEEAERRDVGDRRKPMPSLRMSENCTEPSRLMEPGKVMPA